MCSPPLGVNQLLVYRGGVGWFWFVGVFVVTAGDTIGCCSGLDVVDAEIIDESEDL